MKKNGTLAIGTIWFGAAMSIAEIEAGCRMGGNWTALALGHLLGGLLLFGVGLIGARTRLNAMESTGRAFGFCGSKLFALLNIIQLVGWTSVMISMGASAFELLTGRPTSWWCIPLGGLIAVWLFVRLGGASRLASLCMCLLALLAAFLTFRLSAVAPTDTVAAHPLDFWPAFEISLAMPLSWLPLISDYTKDAARPRTATAVASIVYTLASFWMFAVGFLLARNGYPDLPHWVAQTGRGIGGIGLLLIALSTMATSFLDVYSAGESAQLLSARLRPHPIGLAVCLLGTILAVLGIMDRYMNFLCLIASVFSPMAVVLMIDHYLPGKSSIWWNFCAWAAGTLAYNLAGASPIGPTLTAIAVSATLTLVRKLT